MHRAALQLHQLLDGLALAPRSGAERRRVSIGLAVAAVGMIEAGVSRPGAGGGSGIDAVEVGDHLRHGAVQAVEVEAVEPALAAAVGRAAPVVPSQPADELADDGVAPHPCREAFEAAQRFFRGGVVAQCPDVAVHPIGVRPVGLGGDGDETLLLDQPLGDLGARLVELVGPVRTLADEHHSGVTD